MTVSPLRLFSPEFADPIDTGTQVDRIPGTADAQCLCPRTGIERIDRECMWPYCDWKRYCKPPTKEEPCSEEPQTPSSTLSASRSRS